MRNRTFWRRLIATVAVLAGLATGAVTVPAAANASPSSISASQVHSNDIWW